MAVFFLFFLCTRFGKAAQILLVFRRQPPHHKGVAKREAQREPRQRFHDHTVEIADWRSP